MSETVIKIESLCKRYRLGVIGTGTLTHDLQSWWARVWGKDDPNTKIQSRVNVESSKENLQSMSDFIWALKDISFEVRQGEVLGIIGRNGAGKSTLLKILSRVTAPTSGQIKIKGRVTSLLEVGTGFHPELTGRGNIYLNGAIMGMKRVEIDRKFDEIVAFAEIEKFIDTPVKRYSSGMYVRLAFAVAAHLDSEILLVDEVLAVGDAAFQKKSLGKMGEASKEGRTVLFVSHNMAAIESLCSKSVLMCQGIVTDSGETRDLVRQYLNMYSSIDNVEVKDRADRKGAGQVRLIKYRLSNGLSADSVSDLRLGDEVWIFITLQAVERIRVFVGIQVKDQFGRLIFAFNSREGNYAHLLEEGASDVILHIPSLPFLQGRYSVDVTVNRADNLELCDRIENVSSFMMHPKDVYGGGHAFTSRHGIVFIPHEWNTS